MSDDDDYDEYDEDFEAFVDVSQTQRDNKSNCTVGAGGKQPSAISSPTNSTIASFLAASKRTSPAVIGKDLEMYMDELHCSRNDIDLAAENVAIDTERNTLDGLMPNPSQHSPKTGGSNRSSETERGVESTGQSVNLKTVVHKDKIVVRREEPLVGSHNENSPKQMHFMEEFKNDHASGRDENGANYISKDTHVHDGNNIPSVNSLGTADSDAKTSSSSPTAHSPKSCPVINSIPPTSVSGVREAKSRDISDASEASPSHLYVLNGGADSDSDESQTQKQKEIEALRQSIAEHEARRSRQSKDRIAGTGIGIGGSDGQSPYDLLLSPKSKAAAKERKVKEDVENALKVDNLLMELFPDRYQPKGKKGGIGNDGKNKKNSKVHGGKKQPYGMGAVSHRSSDVETSVAAAGGRGLTSSTSAHSILQPDHHLFGNDRDYGDMDEDAHVNNSHHLLTSANQIKLLKKDLKLKEDRIMRVTEHNIMISNHMDKLKVELSQAKMKLREAEIEIHAKDAQLASASKVVRKRIVRRIVRVQQAPTAGAGGTSEDTTSEEIAALESENARLREREQALLEAVDELSSQNEDLIAKLKESMSRELELSSKRRALVSHSLAPIVEQQQAELQSKMLPHISPPSGVDTTAAGRRAAGHVRVRSFSGHEKETRERIGGGGGGDSSSSSHHRHEGAGDGSNMLRAQSEPSKTSVAGRNATAQHAYLGGGGGGGGGKKKHR